MRLLPKISWSASTVTLALLFVSSVAVAAFVPSPAAFGVGAPSCRWEPRHPPSPRLRLSSSSSSATPSSTTRDIGDDDPLDKFGIDFTKRASLGKLDPVIGRDDEIRRAIQILSRRTKNNPVLIGDPGVGEFLLLMYVLL